MLEGVFERVDAVLELQNKISIQVKLGFMREVKLH